MRIQGKAVLITGAGSGIGRESALLFAREGALVTAVDVNDAAAHETTAMIVADGGRASAFAADVSDAGACEAMVAHAEAEFERIDVLFNNAGIMHSDDDDAITTDEAVWDLTMNINAKGVFLGCKHGIPALRRAGGGSIINMASMVALLGSATPQIAYTASKGAVLSLTRELAVIHAAREHSSQRVVSGAAPHRAVDEVSRHRPEAGAPARAHPDRPLRRGAGDRARRAVPRVGRLVVCHRKRVRRRRRHHVGLRHTGMTG